MGNFNSFLLTVKEKALNLFKGNLHALSDPDHPENLPIPAKNSTTFPSTSTNSQSKSATIDKNSTACSDLYVACRVNNIDKVRKLLEELELADINRIEHNGSTALHAACYHGHQEIVEMLLKAGADRAIRNHYDNLPFHEAKTNEIKDLFYRTPGSNRLYADSGDIEWQLFDEDVLDEAKSRRSDIQRIYTENNLTSMYEKIHRKYIERSLKSFDGINHVREYFKAALEKDDPMEIIKAYTAETELYKVLNRELATGANTNETERKYIVALCLHHPKLTRYSYIGKSFRVMRITDHDSQRFKIGESFMNKTFISSSKYEESVALLLYRHIVSENNSTKREQYTFAGKKMKQWILCTYEIRQSRSALDIHTRSQYVMEGEVLIMPYRVFKIKRIDQVQRSELSNEPFINIVFEECDLSQ